MKVPSGIWHQGVSSRSSKSCKLKDGAPVDCSSTDTHLFFFFFLKTNHTDVWSDWDLENLETRTTLWTLVMFLKPFLTICVVWQGALSYWKKPLLSGNTAGMKGWTWSAMMFRKVAHVKFMFTWMPRPRNSQQTLRRAWYSLHWLLPTVHLGATSFPGKQQTLTQLST